MSDFVGTNLRLIRLFHDLSLTELGERVEVSKQFLGRVETGAESVAVPLENSLAEELDVLPEFSITSIRIRLPMSSAISVGS